MNDIGEASVKRRSAAFTTTTVAELIVGKSLDQDTARRGAPLSLGTARKHGLSRASRQPEPGLRGHHPPHV